MSKRKNRLQQHPIQYIIYIAIAILVILVVTRQNDRSREDDAFGTAYLSTRDQTYYLVSLYGDIIDTEANGAQIQITGVDDPSCPTFDDEITLNIELNIPDIAMIPLNEDISLANRDLITSDIGLTCFCDFDAGNAEYTVSGTINFTELSSDFAEGELSLRLEGDIPATDGTYFEEDTTLEVTIPLFRAPVSVDYCDSR